LKDKQTIALNWTPEYLKEFYDKKKEMEYMEDQSVETVEEDKKTITLKDCLKLFTKEEQLGVDDPWYCSDCKEFRQAFKKFDLWSAPPILIIHLKRFSYRGRFSYREKLDQLVDFPLDNLDLTEYVIGPTTAPSIYDLYAVSNHFGSLGGGHYTAFAKHRDDGLWYCYDDHSVRQVTESAVKSEAAYVLFYRRKDISWEEFDLSLDKAPAVVEDNDEEEGSDDETLGEYVVPTGANSMAVVVFQETDAAVGTGVTTNVGTEGTTNVGTEGMGVTTTVGAVNSDVGEVTTTTTTSEVGSTGQTTMNG